ncbi:acyltransferase family protein [Mangrovicoccus ximenensis]|uniref:hypothetical protein n=1 Tax=Mangrovicoccus ximenensis TaxID=1911570 RepID=UPI0011AEB720|nr:hypothetical protein [Mangrovicoccus ximenensis]
MVMSFACATIFLIIWGFVPSVVTRVIGKNFIGDQLYVFSYYLPFFLIGFVSYRVNGVFDAVFRPDTIMMVLGGAVMVAFVALHIYEVEYCVTQEACGSYFKVVDRILAMLSGFFVSITFYGIVYRCSSGYNAFVSYFVSGSLVMYLFHLPFLLVAGYAFTFLEWPAWMEILALNLIVFFAVVLTFEIVRRSRVLRFLFNGGRVSPKVSSGLFNIRFRERFG